SPPPRRSPTRRRSWAARSRCTSTAGPSWARRARSWIARARSQESYARARFERTRCSRLDAKAVENYRKAGELAARAREHGATLVKEGTKLADVADAVEKWIVAEGEKVGAKPAFPCCISVDADAAHDTPGMLDERV